MKAATSFVALLLAVLLSLVGCSQQAAESDQIAETSVEVTAPEFAAAEQVVEFEDLGWQLYAQLDGDLNVVAYHCCEQGVEVEFANGDVNTYSYESAGAEHVEEMRVLAEAGDGLGAYIEANARTSYEEYVAPVACTDCSGDGKVSCSRCGGKGATYCGECGGDGIITCHFCKGAKRLSCSQCDGTGVLPSGRDCLMCGGSGFTTCPFCKGSGTEKCTACGGTPKTVCSTCGGSGQLDCDTCSGSGFIVEGR